MFIWTGATGSTSLLSREVVLYSDRLYDFSVPIPRCYEDGYVNSSFPRTARLFHGWISRNDLIFFWISISCLISLFICYFFFVFFIVKNRPSHHLLNLLSFIMCKWLAEFFKFKLKFKFEIWNHMPLMKIWQYCFFMVVILKE